MTRFSIIWVFAATLLIASIARADIVYYIHPDGSDDQPGTSIDQPWKTLARASQQIYKPGDRIRLAAGKIFDGPLSLGAKSSGTPKTPIVIESYGEGRAIIRAGVGDAVHIENAGGVEIQNLVCIGEDCLLNHGCGVALVNTLPNNVRLSYLRIRNIEAKGFGREIPHGDAPDGFQPPQGAGIFVGGVAIDRSKSGFEDVEITGCDCHDNAYFGILITGCWDEHATRYANANITIRDCRTYENRGDPRYLKNHSGSGILVEDCDGGLVDGCVAYENGALCDAGSGGPCGIWTGVANRVTIQNCESFRNHTGKAPDGDGFDLDGGCTNCVLQYNYSHDNDGAGILVYTYAGSPHQHQNNVVRFNISENDSTRKRQYGAITVGNDGSGISGLEVYHNTFITRQPAEGVVNLRGRELGVAFRNNAIISLGKAPLIRADHKNPKDMVFQGNLYWSAGGGDFAQIAKDNIPDLLTWRLAGKEMLDGKPVGVFTDPHFDLNSNRGRPGELARFSKLTAFVLPPDSTHRGLDLKPFDIEFGLRDFRGKSIAPDDRPAIGACH